MSDTVEVALRVRPFSQREIKHDSSQSITIDGLRATTQNPKKGSDGTSTFAFEHCFPSYDPDDVTYADQQEVFEAIGQPLIASVTEGINVCLFAYGQTGSGKTYTMMGSQGENAGLIPRMCDDLFESVGWEVQLNRVECSYLEIHNEQVRDLLNPNGVDKVLKVRQHPKLGVHVENLTKLIVKDADEMLKLLEEGNQLRTVASTNMNAHSSRSHSIFTIEVRINRDDQEYYSKANLIDLAGSERSSVPHNKAFTPNEGANINKSLLSLRSVLSKLAESGTKSSQSIPYRDSQLTWLLSGSLGGNCQTMMLATASPASLCYDETLATLRFSETVKQIKQSPVANEDPQQRLSRELRTEIDNIKAQLKAIEQGGKGNKAELLQQLVDNTELFQDVSETEEERMTKQRALQNQRAKGFVKLRKANRIPVDTSTPRLHTLNEDMAKLPEIAPVYYLLDGDCNAGKSDACKVLMKGNDDIADVHCAFSTNFLRRSSVLSSMEDEDGLDTPVYVNGELVHGTRALQHLDRVIIGPLAFRFVLPTSWVEAEQRGDFSRDATEPEHLAAIEEFDRLLEELAKFNELLEAVGRSEALRAMPDGEALAERVAALENQLAVQYPINDAPTVAAMDQALKYDYKFAMKEKDRIQHSKDVELMELENEGASAKADEDIDELMGELNNVEAKVDQLKADREELERDAAELEKKKEAAKKSMPIVLSEDDLPPRDEIDPDDIVSRDPNATAAAISLRAQLAKELLDYEEAMNRARVWKPNGPQDPPQHKKKYQDLLARKNISFNHVTTQQGPVEHQGRIYKLRIKKSLFHKGGFFPVTAVVQDRFLYYFEEKAADAADALGGCYLYGADLAFVADMGDMKYCIRITPSAPRKKSKSNKGPTEDNNIVLGFETEPEMLEWLRKLKIAAEPEISDALKKYFGDDIDMEPTTRITKPPRRETSVQADEKVVETEADRAALEKYKADVKAIGTIETAPNTNPTMSVQRNIPKIPVDEDLAEIGDDWEFINEVEYKEEVPEEMLKYRIPLKDVHQNKYLKCYFRTSLVGDEGKKQAQKNRMWLVDHFTHSVQVVDLKNKVAHMFTAKQVLAIEKDLHEPTKLKLNFFHHGFHPYEEYCVSMEERERFYETVCAIRPTVRVFCPQLVVGPAGEFKDTSTPIDGEGDEARDITSHDPNTGNSATMKLSGQCIMRVSRVPTEPIHIWTGTLNLAAIPLQSAELLGRWIPRSRYDVYVIGIQDASYRRNQTQFFDFMARFFGSDYITVSSVELYDTLLIVVTRKRHYMKITNIESSSCPSTIEALSGERGGVGISFKFMNTSFCFVAVHLPGNAGRQDLRRFILGEVLTGLQLGDRDSDATNQFDHVVLLGDMNYPALKGAGIPAIQDAIKEQTLPEYATKYDSLCSDVAKGRILNGFSEPEIAFPPTYCVEVGTSRFNTGKVAIPTYRSRILLKSATHGVTDDADDMANAIQCSSYDSCRTLNMSEHVPVQATFVAHCLRPVTTCFMPSPIPSIVLVFELIMAHRNVITCVKPAVKVISSLFEPVVLHSDTCAQTPSVYEWNEGQRVDFVTTSLEYINNCFFHIVLFDEGELDDFKRHKGTACISLKECIDRDNENVMQGKVAPLQRAGRNVADLEISFRWSKM